MLDRWSRAVPLYKRLARRSGWSCRSWSFGDYEKAGGPFASSSSWHFARGDSGNLEIKEEKILLSDRPLWLGSREWFCLEGVIGLQERTFQCSLSTAILASSGPSGEIQAFEEINYGFSEDSPYVLPAPDALMSATMNWVESSEQDRMGFYSAESHAEEPYPEAPVPRGKAHPKKPAGKATPSGGGAKPGEKPKRPTTASIAADLQRVLQSLPMLADQVSEIGQRQKSFELQITDRLNTARPQLTQPLSRSLDFGNATPVSALAKDLKPPPRTVAEGALGILTPHRYGTPVGLKELEMEKPDVLQTQGQSPDLAAAVLAQSQALTALVSQISSASNDPMGDLSGSSSSTSNRGALGRAKLQAELAQHKGSFYTSVLAIHGKEEPGPTGRYGRSEVSRTFLVAMLDNGNLECFNTKSCRYSTT